MDKTVESISVINFVNRVSLDELRLFLRENKFRVFESEGRGVRDKGSFFARAIETLPQDPELVAGDPNWDALVDSLWGGLARLDDSRVAILWLEVEKMLERGVPDLLVAACCFQRLASEVSKTEHGFPHPMLLTVFLVGDGENFVPWCG